MRVLVADDSPEVRSRLVEMLSNVRGVEIVGQACSAPEALALVRRERPHAMVLDIRMTGGSGIDVLKAAKRQNPSMAVIMLTNYPYPQYRKKCESLGADFFFDKSSESEKAVEALRRLSRQKMEMRP